MGIAAVGFTAFFTKFTLNVSVFDTNHSLLSPARSSVNRRAAFGRVYVDLRKVQHCHAIFVSDLVQRGVVNLDDSILHGTIISDGDNWRNQALSQVIPKRGTPPSLLVMCQHSSNLMSSRADHISRFSVSAPVPVLCCGTFHVGRPNVGELLQDV